MLRICMDQLYIDQKKMRKQNIKYFIDKMNLSSYNYLQDVNIMYRHSKTNTGILITNSFLELQCHTLTLQQIKKFIKKMKNIGVNGNAKITLWEQDKIVYKFDFDKGVLDDNCKRRRQRDYKYRTCRIWKK